MRLAGVELRAARLPLVDPYVLSFTTVTEISSIVVGLRSDTGAAGLGEAVPLPGYSDETEESVLAALRKLLPGLAGLEVAAARERLEREAAADAFAVSAAATALDLMSADWVLPPTGQVPTLAALSAGPDPEAVTAKALAFCRQGFATLKLKVGRDAAADAACLRLLLDRIPAGVKLRIDANQAYRPEDARRLLEAAAHPRAAAIEHLEQPFGIDAAGWEAHRALVPELRGIPLMLDESIFGRADIERAAAIGAATVKLKLFKHAGPRALMDLAGHARSLGLRVVLGNGVASDVGNLVEAGCHLSGVFAGACEGNGFAKLVEPATTAQIGVQAGQIVWDFGGGIRFDRLLRAGKYRPVWSSPGLN